MAFSDISEEYDQKLLKQVINQSQLAKFISNLPNGIKRCRGTRNKLSGGQKKRLGIARALYKNLNLLFWINTIR